MKKEGTIREKLEQMKRSKYRLFYSEQIATLEWVLGSHKTITAAAKAENKNRQTSGGGDE